MPPDPSDRADGVPPLATGLTVNPTAALLALLAAGLRARQALLATAESCTGGLIAGACTDLAGSSDWFERGLVTYSNRAKAELLGVPETVLAAHGAVSEPVALAMAEGLLVRAPVAITAAVTGIAGPGGGSAEKPVGLVWLAWAWRAADGAVHTEALRQVFPGDRAAVRAATVACALQGVLDRLERLAPPAPAPAQAPAPAGASRPAPAAGATPGRNPATRGAGP